SPTGSVPRTRAYHGVPVTVDRRGSEPVMFTIPRRERLGELTDAAQAIAPTLAVGFARALDSGRVSIVDAYQHGLCEWVLPEADVPDVFQPSGPGWCERVSSLESNPGVIERFLNAGGVGRIASARLPGDTPTRFWIGFTSPAPLTPDQHD